MEGGHNANLPTCTAVDRLPHTKQVRWTGEEETALWKGVQKHGSDFAAMVADASLPLSARPIRSLEGKWTQLRRADPDLKSAGGRTAKVVRWTSEEETTLQRQQAAADVQDQPPQCPPSRAARKRSLRLLLALASPRCSKPRPGLSPDAFRARISWARLSDPSDIARLMPHICPVAAACARGRGSGAIIAEPSQRSLSRER
jgi:hypothetical protein